MDWVPLCSWHKATNQTCPVAITCYHTCLHCIISIWHVISYTVLMSLNHSKLIANLSLLKIPCGKTDSFWPVWQVVSKTSNFVINPVEQTEGFFFWYHFCCRIYVCQNITQFFWPAVGPMQLTCSNFILCLNAKLLIYITSLKTPPCFIYLPNTLVYLLAYSSSIFNFLSPNRKARSWWVGKSWVTLVRRRRNRPPNLPPQNVQTPSRKHSMMVGDDMYNNSNNNNNFISKR